MKLDENWQSKNQRKGKYCHHCSVFKKFYTFYTMWRSIKDYESFRLKFPSAEKQSVTHLEKGPADAYFWQYIPTYTKDRPSKENQNSKLSLTWK